MKTTRVSGQDIIERATQMRSSYGIYPKPEFANPAFREALLQVAGDAGVINSRRLSKWIGSNENRIVDSFRILRKGMLRGFMTWELQHVGSERADAARSHSWRLWWL